MALSHSIKRMATVSLCAALLIGCQTAKEVLEAADAPEPNVGPCPEAFALYEAARFVEFRGPESYKNVGFTGEIEKVRSVCRYYGERPIEANLEMDISFGRGPAVGQQSGNTYQYFVSVTRKNIEVITKQVFPISVTFPPGQNVVSVTEKVGQITIPRATENTSGANFEIIVGFDLTPAQIAFNADGKRFRVSAGQ